MTSPPDEVGAHVFRVLVIADVRGYSSFADQRGDEAAAALAQRFLDAATDVLANHHGQLIGTRGDEVVASFESARSALQASVALQGRFLAETEQNPDLPLPVGIGLDMGEVVVVDDGYMGNAINIAARLCSIAPAGAILATREVAHVAQALEGIRYESRPPARLKGISEPVQYVRVVDAAGDTVIAYERLGRTQAARPPRHRRIPLRRPTTLVASGLVLVLVIVLVIFALPGSSRPAAIAPNVIASLDSTGATLTSVRLTGHPTGVAGGYGAEWVTSTTTDQIFRVSWKTGSVTSIGVGSQPEGIAVGAGAVWVADSGDGTVDRINPLSNTVVDSIPVGTGPNLVTVFDSRVWVTDSLDASVSEIDPARNAVARTIPTGAEPAGIAGGDGIIWVADQGSAKVQLFDPTSGDQVSAPVSVGNGPTAVAYGAGAAWVTNSLDGTLSRIQAANDSVTTSQAGAGANSVAVGATQVWVSNEDGNSLSEYSTAGALLRTVSARSAPSGIAFSDGRIWVASDGIGATAHRGGVLVVDSGRLDYNLDPSAIDPGYAYSLSLWRILIMTNDGLVGYRRSGGLEGGTLVPDLARFIPSPTDGGLTYTFYLRNGIRYSDGRPVRASDFRYALARAVKIDSIVGGGPSYYFSNVLVGGDRCASDPRTCSFAKGIETNNRTGEVVFHLVRADPDFLNQLALPTADAVPSNTRVNLPTGGSVPATGPYEILSYRPFGPHAGRAVLVRNPFFRQWSAAAQPAGFPERIVINTGLPLPTEIRAVETGRADVMWNAPTESEYSQMHANYPSQTYVNSLPDTSFFFLNTRVAPFSSLAARRAVNYALDRRALTSVEAIDDFSGGGKITCQVLPPDFPSYERYCPYTLDPGGGNWTAPDLVTAKTLVAQSGMKGTRVTVVDTPFFGNEKQSMILVRTLNELGFVARLREIPANKYFPEVANSKNGIQAGFFNWQSDYIAASNFFEPLLACNSFQPSSSSNLNASELCDRSIDREIARAAEAQLSNSGASVADWTKVDHEVVDEAPWVPVANPQTIDFVSRRVGNYQFNPQFGELADLLWVQ